MEEVVPAIIFPSEQQNDFEDDNKVQCDDNQEDEKAEAIEYRDEL